MSESAEAIAKVVVDLRAGRILDVHDVGMVSGEIDEFKDAVVVDATAVYHDLLKRTAVRLYEDHRLAPVWPNALIGYLNEHGNATVIHMWAVEREAWDRAAVDLWESDAGHTIDWDRVRWIEFFTIYSGYRTQVTRPIPTGGPLHLFRAAVYPDGEIADLRWIAVSGDVADNDRWDMAQLITLGAINLGNCVNVELMTPKRPRHAQRRLDRTGVRVTELHVRPISKSYRGNNVAYGFGATPIHSVRGHFAEYGVNGRGLLFGKYAGRFWIPSHARGNPEHGEVEQTYAVEP